jgi:uncharacterized protein (DUF924 family)
MLLANKCEWNVILMNYQDIIDFWFHPETQPNWFSKSPAFDQSLVSRFSGLHQQAIQGELWSWRESIQGRLAEIIVLDQFSRNMFRDTPRAFAQDAQALSLAQEALRSGEDERLETIQRSFLYLPFMHSESTVIHIQALALYEKLGSPHHLDYEIRHKDIIDRFGRYPHRNQILGRESTAEELMFLTQPNSSF